MPISANLHPGSGLLSVRGDADDNAITISRDAAGTILINDGAVPVDGDQPTIVNTNLVEVHGGDGNDVIAIDDTNGPLPAATLIGGAGNDTITGGHEDDRIVGGPGDDQLFGGAGNDTFVWRSGDGSDVDNGGFGTDTLELHGGQGAETFSVSAAFRDVVIEGNSGTSFSIRASSMENVVIHAGSGDDLIAVGAGAGVVTNLTLDGGRGNDTFAFRVGFGARGGFGNVAITNFTLGSAANHDTIEMHSLPGLDSFDQVIAHASVVAGHVVIGDARGDTITLDNVHKIEHLQSFDFDFVA
jgi:Ca2+-binding RTX toxin-like protein